MNFNVRNFKAARGSMMVCIVGLCAAPAHAATITITANAPDVLNGGNASCALREAIQNINDAAATYADCANTGAAYGISDTINIPAGTYTNAIASTIEQANANGSLDIQRSVTITGAGATTTIIDGGSAGVNDRVFAIASGITVWVSGVTIQNGRSTAGAGIYNTGTTTISDSTISGNMASNYGGGIYNSNSATVDITDSTITGNSASLSGGGFLSEGAASITGSTIANNTAQDRGGAIFNGSYGSLTVSNSVVSGNAAAAKGGGVANFGGLSIMASTVDANTATTYGGGIYSKTGASITDSTISGNTANGLGGGIYNDGGTVDAGNTILAVNAAPDGSDCYGAITSSDYNLIQNSVGCTISGAMAHDIYGQDPVLGSLQDNGGPTFTRALLAGSPAIDAGNCAAGTDQRGIARPQGAQCDIGAYESPDTTPDAFSFTAQTGVARSTVTTSNTITVSGINSAASISVTNGEYAASTDGGSTWSAWSSTTPSTVSLNDQIKVRLASSGSYSMLTTATLIIGGVSGAFDVSTLDDTIPSVFSFTAQTGVALSSVATSNTITVSGINAAAAISIVSGTYSINGGGYTSVAGTVSNGDTVTLRQTASGSYSTPTTATLTIGGVSGAFDVTTLAATTSYTGPTATGTGNATAIISGAGCGFTAAQFVPIAVSPPPSITFPHGLLNFTLNGCTLGGTVTLNITYPSAVPIGTQYWKYGPTPTNHASHWYTIPAIISGNTITFSITDGEEGDDDYTANGVIVDAGGPGVHAAQATPTAIPTLSEWGVILLAGILGVFGMVGVRRNNPEFRR